MNADIRYYLSILMKRAPLFLLVAAAVSSVGLAVAVILPTVYTASGRLLVEDPQIPTRMAASTVQVGEREQLAIIQQRVLTRATLLDIAREYQVYEDIGTMNADEIVSRMRADTTFQSSGRRSDATVMDVVFSARTGAIAADVANEYITRILAENARQRQSRASDTLDFFEQEVDRLETELSLSNERMLRFQNENRDALPSTLEYRLSRQNRLQERLAEMARERTSLEERRARLFELQQSGITRLRPTEEDLTQTARQLASLRDQLVSARAVYTEESPRVRMLKARIEALEEQVQAQPALMADAEPAQDAPDPVSLEIEQVDGQLQEIGERSAEVEAEVAQLQATIDRTPANSITLQAMRRDYQHIERQYERALNRLSEASTGERIETLSKGQRITVIQQATAPSEPSDPNRPMIAGTGIALGVGAASALVVLLELLNRAIRRPVDLTNRLGITPIASVPYIATPGERLRRRVLGLLGIAAILVGIPAALWFVHYEVMPLDLIYDKVRSELLP